MLDLTDRRILAELMADAAQPVARIADAVGLSQTPCWKRIKRLEERGVIRGRVIVPDLRLLGLELTVFLTVRADHRSPEWRTGFLKAVVAIPAIMETWRLAGEGDYLLRIVTTGLPAFDGIARMLGEAVPIVSLQAQFAIECLQERTVFPLATKDG